MWTITLTYWALKTAKYKGLLGVVVVVVVVIVVAVYKRKTNDNNRTRMNFAIQTAHKRIPHANVCIRMPFVTIASKPLMESRMSLQLELLHRNCLCVLFTQSVTLNTFARKNSSNASDAVRQNASTCRNSGFAAIWIVHSAYGGGKYNTAAIYSKLVPLRHSFAFTRETWQR